MNKSIRVGLFNWASFPLQNGFYPADLPAEWKLSFYANEFESACINLCEIVAADQFFEWFEDLPEEFQLSFMIDPSQLNMLTELVNQGGLKIHYLLVAPSEPDILSQNSANKTLLSGATICDSERVVSLSTIWTPDNDSQSSAIALLPDSNDLRLYRQWIELWVENSSQQKLTLWLDGGTARYSTLSELRTLVELMGY